MTPEFDPISGVVRLHWYWSGPNSFGEKHAEWRCYTPTGTVDLLERAGLRLRGAYKGFSKTPYKAEGREGCQAVGSSCCTRGLAFRRECPQTGDSVVLLKRRAPNAPLPAARCQA
jgi:hypothetical protein